jgi:hypothetical protein
MSGTQKNSPDLAEIDPFPAKFELYNTDIHFIS